ncbi:MAG: hypothetical protein SA339_02220 [Methanomassiliicoccus sp.]|nr:hypothetical protein [Methanomassiliicoccus sp.]
MTRTSKGRTMRKKGLGDLEGRMDRLEARIKRLERAVLQGQEAAGSGECTSCDDLIGCLDDCVADVQELRKKVRDARS